MAEQEKKQDDKRDEEVTPVDGRDFRVEGNDVSGYVGVDPSYRNYADETHRAYLTDDERKMLHKHGLLTDEEHEAGLTAADVVEEDKSDKDESEGGDKSNTSSRTPAKKTAASKSDKPLTGKLN